MRVQLLQELGRRQLLAVLLVLADHRHLHRVTMLVGIGSKRIEVTSRLSTRIVYSFFPFLTPRIRMVRYFSDRLQFHNSVRILRKLTFELLMNVGVSETIVALKTSNQDLRIRNKYQ